jgi:RNA polymerase sigma-70 factor, ECF subfamily
MSSRTADQPRSPTAVEAWLREAQRGSREALDRMLEGCRQYLLLVAGEHLDADLRPKVGPSDLVQDTFCEAQRDFGRFHGHTEQQLLAWLRRILLNNLADVREKYQARKRVVGREVPLADAPREELRHSLARADDSPGTRLVAREQVEALQRALDQLPPETRLVIDWRNYDLCSFAEIGRRLGKSEEAARKIWSRALDELERLLAPPA